MHAAAKTLAHAAKECDLSPDYCRPGVEDQIISAQRKNFSFSLKLIFLRAFTESTGFYYHQN